MRLDHLASGAAGPEAARELAERAAGVQRALLRLSPEARAAVLLHGYQGLTHEEIARAQGISPSTARKRYSRALEDLRGHLESWRT